MMCEVTVMLANMHTSKRLSHILGKLRYY